MIRAWPPLLISIRVPDAFGVGQATDSDSFGEAGFELVDAVEYWEPSLDGFGPPENPVPTADGTQYSAPADANGDYPSENGHLNMVSRHNFIMESVPRVTHLATGRPG